MVWDRLAQVCGQYLGKGQQVAVEGRLQTRQWDDDRGARHWKTEIVATTVEMLSGRRKRDYEAESLNSQVVASGEPGSLDGDVNDASESADDSAAAAGADASDEDEQALVLA